MRLNRTQWVIALMLILSGLCGPAQAGQIVDTNMRQWAKQAIAQEAKLDLKISKKAVAVMYFHNQTGNHSLDPLQKGLAIMLITDLGKIDTIHVVERARLQALMEELHLGTSGLVSAESAPRAGRLLGAGYLVGGELDSVGSSGFQIDSDLVQVENRRQVGGTSSQGKLADLLRMEKKILFELVRLLKLELTPEQRNLLKQPLSNNIEALISFFKGIDEGDKGNYETAEQDYKRSMQMDPKFSLPADALRELQDLGLVKGHSRSRSMIRKLRDRVTDNDEPIPEGAGRRDRTGSIIRQPVENRALPPTGG